MDTASLPMAGVRILEFGQLLAVPHAAKLLCDMGAEVIKIESVGRLNAHRTSSFFRNTSEGEYWNHAANYNDQNRSKLEITLDMKAPEGIAIAKELVKISDILCENFSARVMENFSLDYEAARALRPDIIMLSSNGYGHTGPWAEYVAAGHTTESASGLIWMSGYPDLLPRLPSIPYTDYAGAMHGAFAMMAALHYRDLTGQGQWIDLAQSETGTAMIGEAVLDYIVNGHQQGRMGNRDQWKAPHGCYPCLGEDEWVVIAVSSDEEWDSLCRAMGSPEWCNDPKFADQLSRYKHQDELDGHIRAWTAQRDHYAAMHRLQRAGVPAGAVLNNKELLLDPQYRARGFYQSVEHPEETGLGTMPYPGPPWKFTRTPGSVRRAAPTLGQDNELILGTYLGLSQREIAALEAKKIIGKAPLQPSRPNVVPLEEQKRRGTITDYEESPLNILRA